jgi:hypothetical protein
MLTPSLPHRCDQKLRNWLQHHFAPDDERVNGVQLAVYEAIANATVWSRRCC